ncbi:hypothetical protein [Alcaligenes aquatilis]|uniref:hypothetical protein n=1 Tax=Alcaligenes aquatilis TaxID=323284 RepID=UPI00309ECCF3
MFSLLGRKAEIGVFAILAGYAATRLAGLWLGSQLNFFYQAFIKNTEYAGMMSMAFGIGR